MDTRWNMRATEVFPAHAGMSPFAQALLAGLVGFPRSRGDEPFALADGLTLEEFSPLTRG